MLGITQTKLLGINPMWNRGQRPQRPPMSDEDKAEIKRRLKNFDSDDRLFGEHLKQVNQSVESARSMYRELEESKECGDGESHIRGCREDFHRHLDKADSALNQARSEEEDARRKRQR
jgi:predicted nuclease with TOPRIM domain